MLAAPREYSYTLRSSEAAPLAPVMDRDWWMDLRHLPALPVSNYRQRNRRCAIPRNIFRPTPPEISELRGKRKRR